jgi:broad specificity phosphatase PhoE
MEYFEGWAFLRHGKAQNNKAKESFEAGDKHAYDAYVRRPSQLHDLTKKGKGEARQAGRWIRENLPPFRHYIVSPHVRALKTADESGLDGPWKVDNRFCEKEGGVFHEMRPKEANKYRRKFKNKAPEAVPYWFHPDRGQSFSDLEKCARWAVASLKNSSLAVGHGHKISVIDHIIMRGENGWDMESGEDPDWQMPNCTLIQFKPKYPAAGLDLDGDWLRRVSFPCRDELGEWEEIIRPLYSREGLRKLAKRALSRLG